MSNVGNEAEGGLRALYRSLLDEDPLLAGALRDPGEAEGEPEAPQPPRIAARGPRARDHAAEYELLVDTIYEGYLLHYGEAGGAVLHPGEPDLALLLGDQLYALGLSRLAELGDLEAVHELADVISLVAQAHTASDPDLAAAVWEAGATAVGWGSGPGHGAAKAAARAGEPEAAAALRTAAREGRNGAAPPG